MRWIATGVGLRPRLAVTMLAACAAVRLCGAAVADEAPLHERIDALIESVNPGFVGPPATDAEFLRRAYLDLNGTIPDAATARAFLDDPAPNKRAALVDRLLDRPQFARHLANVFDVELMERRPDKVIKTPEWREYLRQSFAANKPLDQLAREILSADGVEPASRPAARFYLDRDGDPNLLARDIGRLFFGRDLQCAQCHDHPLVEDYLQADYYGLLAFVQRGVLFTGADKLVVYAENGEGEVNYKSVFTGDARDRVLPKVPQGEALGEPVLSKEEVYVVAPTKDVRGVPKYSRRARLAAVTTSGTSAAFNRNWANRLWAQLMGRGLVHPLDMQHSGNAAMQSPLLTLLADELVRTKFDTKSFLRELALTRAYARGSQTPQPGDIKVDATAVGVTLAGWTAEAERLAAEVTALQAASAQAITELNAAYEAFSKAGAAHDAAEKARAEAKKASDALAAALAAGIKDVAAKDDVLKALVEARDKGKVAAAKLPDDNALAVAAGQFQTRSAEVEAQLAVARKLVADKTAEVQTASVKQAELDKAVQLAAAEMTAKRTVVEAADGKSREALEKYRASKALQGELSTRSADGRLAINIPALGTAVGVSSAALVSAKEQLTSLKSSAATTETATVGTAEAIAQAESAVANAEEKAVADRTALERSWSALVERATARFALAPLKPLSPEQMAWATMQSLGLVDQQVTALAPQAKKDVEAMAAVAAEARPREEAKLLEARVDEKLVGNVAPFVSLFGQQPGQAPTFQATVHQALFLSNGGMLASWLNPGGNNLTERLTKMDDGKAVADELYLSVLTRRPTAEEQQSVTEYWTAAGAERAAAAREMVWSLLTSAEFRFNH